MDLPVFWIPFLAKTAQVEFHRQEFYLFKREKIRKLSIKKMYVAITTPQKTKAHLPTTLKLQSESGKVSLNRKFPEWNINRQFNKGSIRKERWWYPTKIYLNKCN